MLFISRDMDAIIRCKFCCLCILFFGCFGYASTHGRQFQPNMTCPSEDPVSHECYDITMTNTSCRVPSGVDTTKDHGLTVHYDWRNCLVYQCQHKGCCKGWTRDIHGHCTIAITDDMKVCQNGGLFNTSSSRCDCLTGYTGEWCETNTCEGWCTNGGWCEIVDDQPRCICPSNFLKGDRCEQVICSRPCQNGGTCVKDGVLGVCQCPQGYQGDLCQYDVNPNCPVFSRGHLRDMRDVYDNNNNQKCNTNSDCAHTTNGATLCCYNGTFGVCRKSVRQTCQWDGQEYTVGVSFRPSPCQVCVCQVWGDVHCTFIQCPETECPDGHTAIKVPGHCCKICPGQDMEAPAPPKFENCPDLVPVPVSDTGSSAILPQLHIVATDWLGGRLNVWFSHTNFSHSRSSDVHTNMHYVTAYSDCDQYGRRAECVFRALVTDRVAPVFQSCPTEIYALDNERITWKLPTASDNVGISRMEANGDDVYGKHLAIGTYTVSYTIWDFDQNKAICAFIIKVFTSDFNTADEHNQNTTRGNMMNYKFIIASCFAVFLIMLTIFVIICLRSWLCTTNRANRPRHPHTNQENIYAICGPPTRGRVYENTNPLPAYTPPTNPPSYDDLDHTQGHWGYVNTHEMQIYDELDHKDDTPKYVNEVRGELNTSFINDQHQMEYMKL